MRYTVTTKKPRHIIEYNFNCSMVNIQQMALQNQEDTNVPAHL